MTHRSRHRTTPAGTQRRKECKSVSFSEATKQGDKSRLRSGMALEDRLEHQDGPEEEPEEEELDALEETVLANGVDPALLKEFKEKFKQVESEANTPLTTARVRKGTSRVQRSKSNAAPANKVLTVLLQRLCSQVQDHLTLTKTPPGNLNKRQVIARCAHCCERQVIARRAHCCDCAQH